MRENPLELKKLSVRKAIHTGTDVFDPASPRDLVNVWYESRTTGKPLTVPQIEDLLRLSPDDVRNPEEKVRRALIMAGYISPRGEVVASPSSMNGFHREMRAWGLSRTSKSTIWPPEVSSWAAYKMLRRLASEQGFSFPPVYKGWKRYEDNPGCRQCGTVGTPSRGCRRVHVHGESYCCGCWESFGNVVRRCVFCRGRREWGYQKNPRYSLTVGHRDPESSGSWKDVGFEGIRKSRTARQKAMSRAEELKREGYDVELRISPESCITCRGRGHVYGSYRSGLLTTQSVKESCPTCKGTGKDPSDPTVAETIQYEENQIPYGKLYRAGQAVEARTGIPMSGLSIIKRAIGWKENPSRIRVGMPRKNEWGEWEVPVFVEGKKDTGKTYYTDDKEDAFETYESMVKTSWYEENPLGREVKTTRRLPGSVRMAVRRVMRSRVPETIGDYYLTPARGGVQVFRGQNAWYVPVEGEWNPSLPRTGKYSVKPYRCRECGTVKDTGTNHWGSIYPYCNTCGTVTVWECMEPMPKGYQKPEEWKIARLGDVADIEEGRT